MTRGCDTRQVRASTVTSTTSAWNAPVRARSAT
jgi:hypothetical protein